MFFQTGGSVLALWGRADLAEDSVIEDGGGSEAWCLRTTRAHPPTSMP